MPSLCCYGDSTLHKFVEVIKESPLDNDTSLLFHNGTQKYIMYRGNEQLYEFLILL